MSWLRLSLVESDCPMHYKHLQKRMVEEQIIKRGIKDTRVLKAIEKVPRHLFVDEALRESAYGDHPLPIGEKQTISQPYMVALMTHALDLTGNEKVLEIGTGSGYQTAILCELCEKVYSVERISTLASKARNVIESLGYLNVVIRISDGTYGWSEESPFDRIIVSAYAPDIPELFINQLKPNGIIVLPLGNEFSQTLVKAIKTDTGIKRENITGCTFVKLIGKYGFSA